MKTVLSSQRPALAAIAIAAMLSACGGGDPQSTSENLAAPASRSYKLIVVVPPPDSDCTATTLAVSNIDFGQAGWAGDDAPSDPVVVNTAIPVALSFKGSAVDTHTVDWAWGDGVAATVPGLVAESGGVGFATQTHAYAAAGVYTVSATVTNRCAKASVDRLVVVYDPSAGFVTGGGWMISPAGAYAADAALTGRATFGFVSKYLKGATVPIGQTEFQFHAGRLNFHSQSYDWLVIAGARAQYKGTGSVNGKDGFKFMLTAVDGALLAGDKQADRFRIKIWHADAIGNDVVDYDNQVDAKLEGGSSEGTAIGGGSIVIHK